MRLLEYQAKRMFAAHGIAVPGSNLVSESEDLGRRSYPAVLKAQIPLGGRGKAGGIVRVENAAHAADALSSLLEMEIHGHPVRRVLVEDVVSAERELYLSMMVDRQRPAALLLASARGGIDIEETGKSSPHEILRFHMDPCLGMIPSAVRYLAGRLDVRPEPLGQVVRAMLGLFRKYDATLIEINPVAVVGQQLVALDAKVILDDNAAFRHAALWDQWITEQRTIEERPETPSVDALMRKYGMAYVPLDGDVALISDGAGTGMLTLDLIEDAGGRAANFCELGGAAGTETMQLALGVVLANPAARVLLISLLGGLTRMDEVAAGILAYREQADVSIPLVVRMCGTQEEAGRSMLEEVGIPTLDDLPDAVRAAVNLAKGGAA